MPKDKQKVAIFDCCGTFVNFQTADAYINFATADFISDDLRNKNEKKIALYKKLKIIGLHDRLTKKSMNKKLIAKLIKNMPIDVADKMAKDFIEQKIKPNTIKQTLALLEEYKKQGAYIVFVSAAYDIYLKYIVKEFGFDDYISTKLCHNKKVMTGKLSNDCVGKDKVKYAHKLLDKKFGRDNYEVIFSIGDSSSDIPVLNLANRKVVISAKKHQDWVNKDYEEIIYE